jgi:hypothetical protein
MNIKLRMAAHSYSTWRLKQEDQEFKATLGYIARHCQRKKEKKKGDRAEGEGREGEGKKKERKKYVH